MNPTIFASLTVSLLLTPIIIPPLAYAQDSTMALSPITTTEQNTNTQNSIKNTVQPQLCFPVYWRGVWYCV